MDNNIIGLINLQGPNYMEELSRKRPMASEPFAGKYRLIDFALSTMVNAGVDTVLVLTGEATAEDAAESDTPPTAIYRDMAELLAALRAAREMTKLEEAL